MLQCVRKKSCSLHFWGRKNSTKTKANITQILDPQGYMPPFQAYSVCCGHQSVSLSIKLVVWVKWRPIKRMSTFSESKNVLKKHFEEISDSSHVLSSSRIVSDPGDQLRYLHNQRLNNQTLTHKNRISLPHYKAQKSRVLTIYLSK